MALDYRDLVALARELETRTESEAALRTAVGRYYYATLTLVRGLFIPKPSRREGFQQASSVLGRQTKSETQSKFDALYKLRLSADYEPQVDGWERAVVKARRHHERIVAELRSRGHSA